MSFSSQHLKRLINEQANRRLARRGYSPWMASDAKREVWWWLQARAGALARRRSLLRGLSVVWTDIGKAELLPIELPLAGRGEVTLEVLASAISSGTERAQYLRLPSATVSYPYRPGYSAAGIVLAVGQGVHGVDPGDFVAARQVGHASIATVDAASVYAIPDGVRVEDAAFVELGIIGRQGVQKASLRPGDSVCVVGAGVVAALAQRIAAAEGAEGFTVIARSRRREQSAIAGGAAAFLVTGRDDEAISRLSADVVIEATGDPDAVSLAAETAAPDGRIVLLGSPRGMTEEFPTTAVRQKRLELIGAHVSTLERESSVNGDGYRREAEYFLELLRSGRVVIGDLVGGAIDPRECDLLYRSLAASQSTSVSFFDWARIPREHRVQRARLSRLPDMSARGIEFEEQRPRIARKRRAVPGPGNAFESAVGDLRVGLLGCGDIAIHNAAAVATAPNARLVSCYDPARPLADELAATYGATSEESPEALLQRPDVDAVFLSVPHHLHAPLGLQAVAAGKHVIMEKPLAQNLEAARHLVTAAAAADVVLSVCFPHRYEPRIIEAKRLIEAGGLGDAAGVLLTYIHDKPSSYWLVGYSGRSVSDWRASKERAGGGVLIMNLSHYLDLVRHLLGVEVETVAALTDVEDPTRVEDTVAMTIRFANGAVGSVLACSAARGNRNGRTTLELWGTDGHIAIDPEPRVYSLRALDGLATGRWHAFGEHSGTDIRAVYVSRLGSAIHRGEPPDVSGVDGLAVQAVIEAAYRSNELAGDSVKPSDLLVETR